MKSNEYNAKEHENNRRDIDELIASSRSVRLNRLCDPSHTAQADGSKGYYPTADSTKAGTAYVTYFTPQNAFSTTPKPKAGGSYSSGYSGGAAGGAEYAEGERRKRKYTDEELEEKNNAVMKYLLAGGVIACMIYFLQPRFEFVTDWQVYVISIFKYFFSYSIGGLGILFFRARNSIVMIAIIFVCSLCIDMYFVPTVTFDYTAEELACIITTISAAGLLMPLSVFGNKIRSLIVAKGFDAKKVKRIYTIIELVLFLVALTAGICGAFIIKPRV